MAYKKWQWLPWNALLFTCLVGVAAGQNLPTISYSAQNGYFMMKEDLPVGANLGWAELRDGPGLFLRVKSDVIRLEKDNGLSDSSKLRMNVLLNKRLDYDAGITQSAITLTGGNANFKNLNFNINLFVQPVNDETPLFVNLPYSVAVAEDQAMGSLDYTSIHATDRDKGDNQTYSMKVVSQDVNGKNPFSINSKTARLILNEGLDYETDRFYHYSLTVQDGAGHTDKADIFITVGDVQDTPPYFSSPAYHSQLQENTLKGMPVLQVRAWDGDKGVSNSISYTMKSESCPGLFKVDSSTGNVTLKTSPDRDTGAVKDNGGNCELRVVATEGNEHPQVKGKYTQETLVTISILDVNDNPPVFSQPSYTADVDENTQQSMPISLHTELKVSDIDQGENAKFQVRLTTLQSYFEVVPSTVQTTGDITIRIKNSSILDYEERQSLTIKLEASEQSGVLLNTAEISLSINNVNDNAPKFDKYSYTADLLEGSPIGTMVEVIKATDGDRNDGGNAFGSVTHTIENGDNSFQIDKTSGEVKSAKVFDRETRKLYFLTIVAEDGGKRKSRTSLTINIKDVNDNHPVFGSNLYQSSLQEKSITLSNPIVVDARDNDEAGTPYATVSYKLLSSQPQNLLHHFSMDHTKGILTVSNSLDYEDIRFNQGHAGMIELVVVAFDGGDPSLSSNTTVVISLQDMNDHNPTCKQASYRTTIQEDIAQGTPLTSLNLDADDKDGAQPNNIYFFSLDRDSLSTFSINSQTGQISTVALIDRETKSSYTITVYVTDRGLPSRNSSCTVTVTVSDINDELPVFSEALSKVSHKENEELHWICNVKDKDKDARLSYSINWDKSSGQDGAGSLITKTELQSWVEMESSTCKVNSRKRLNREEVKEMTLQIEVKDMNGQLNKPQIGSATLHIEVLDENDESPHLEGGPVFIASVRENTQKGSQIFLDSGSGLTVVDKDQQGDNSKFNVTLLNHRDIFEITPGVGESRLAIKLIVFKNGALDYETVQNYTLKLVAIETHTIEKLKSTSTVIVKVTNENDNVPQFIGGPFNASVPECSKMGTSVIIMEAGDADMTPFGRFYFKLEDPDGSNRFQINNTSGLVTVGSSNDLNREKHPSFSLTVLVTDIGGFSSRTQLIVNLLDVNDNKPVFEPKQHSVFIKENQNGFIPLLYVRATDDDEPGNKNSILTYSLSSVPASLRSNFSIDSQSGEITLNKPLDFESLNDEPGIRGGKISLTVKVKDGGNPSLEDIAHVFITVLDENDNPPQFTPTANLRAVFENATNGSLIAEVNANDPDITKSNNEVSFEIDTLSADTFSIGSISGKITLKGKLDRETKDSYSIRVTARDSGKPSQTAMTVVHVEVKDVNDGAPYFIQGRDKLRLPENENLIWTCQAKDLDKNPKLVYRIDWDKSSGQNGAGSVISGADLKSWIEMESDACKVKSKKPLDREQVNTMKIQIQVEDIAGQMNTPQIGSDSLYIDVLDLNDESPQFEGGPVFSASVRENTQKGSLIYLDSGSGLNVVDKDQRGKNSTFNVVLLNHTDIFEITQNHGVSQKAIKLKVIKDDALDYELHKQYILELKAYETLTSKKLSSTSTVIINVLNENDNIPQFIGGPFNASVPENSKKGTSVITMQAQDCDLPPFKSFKFAIQDLELSKIFQIDSTTGLMTVVSANDLDREKHASYSVTVSATDSGGFSSITQLIVYLSDENDHSPIFEENQYTMSIKENAKKFIPSLYVHANDEDEPGNKNSNLTYSLSHVPASLESNFSVDPQSGEITLNKPLDFESLNDEPGITGGEVSLTVTVKDGGSPSLNDSVQVVITVKDENDNSPVFVLNKYSAMVPENAINATWIVDVKALDSDRTNNEVSYTIDTLSADTFTIDKASGKITLTGKLDRETRDQYSIRVTAIDSGEPPRTATAVVDVNVRDINDEAPSFDEIRADLSISEHKMVNWTCQAKDSDKNPKLVYSIDWDKSSGQNGDGSAISGKELESWIEIDSDTCEVKSKSKEPLDREKVNQMTLQIQVKDVAGQVNKPQLATATLYINVLDVNDESPHFEGGSTFYASVRENTPNGSQIYLDSGSGLIVVDKDQRGKNSAFRVILLNHTDIFEIEPDAGKSRQAVQLKVIKNNALDYEDCQQYTLELLAMETSTSQRLNSTSTVVINVLNENDNIPQFIGAPFNASVPENSEMGTPVITMKADDHDSPPFGCFHFSIEDSKPSNAFQIDASTGLVTVISRKDLNREEHPSYSVTVSVTDVGGFLSRTQLIVNILDVNDNSPKFEPKKYTFSINENSNDFIPRQFVHANDEDEPGNKNSELTYSLSHVPASLRSYFNIDHQSGEITLNKPLDFESLNDEPGITGGEVSLTVTVEDGGSPSLNDSAQVVITVKDENDNPPVFNIPLHAKDIFENSTIGSLIADVKAHDSDCTNNEVSYSIDTLSADTFTIDKTSGKITLAGKLDRETREQYSIRVTAIDSGEPPRTATAVVDVTVRDINDEAPSFDEIRADLSISEHKMVNWTCQAKDSDKNPKLVYSIDWDKSSGQNGDGSALSGKELESWIEIDSDTCEVKSKSKEPLDREKVNQMTLQIQVEDVAGQVNKPQLATATLYINVLDVNDESPRFEGGSTFYASVRENTPNGSQIYLDSGSGLIVVDKDQRGKNSAFRVILLNHTDIFEIEPDSGESRQAVQLKVIKNNALDYEDCQQYTLELLAVETNTSQRLNSTSTVVINVLNENDNVPQFIGAPFNASVPENSEMGTSVITMKADDHDSLPFGRFHFSIEDSKPRNVFQIDASTGLVTVISGADLDREKHPSYSVTVSVTDVGGFLSRTQLIVNILDVNDNPPVFELKKYTFSINENRNDFIPRQFVRANDKDEPGNKNSNLTYSLSHAPASLESNFSIDPQSGEITLNKPLDFESLNDEPGITGGEVSLTVTVEDGGSPSMNDSVQVVITVMDENDNPPVFNIALHAKDIFENSTIGSLIAEVEAHDSDRTNNEVSYSIDTLSADTFTIDKTSGKITLTGKLDRETRDQYSIRVTAIDSGEPPRTATAVVDVTVIDINDEAPSFDEIRADLSISEHKMVNWTCQAKDSDKNPKLVYSIDWDKSSGQNGDGSALSGKELESWIEIDSDTCEVKSKSKEPLDREKVNQMTLQIQVEDVAGQVNKPQLATATLYINVLDVNDESPHFEGGSTIFYASVRENTPNGSQIYLDSGSGLIVVDKDQRGKNSAFRVILLNHTDIFEIEPDTGDSRQAVQLKVIKKNALDYEDCQQYTLELLAVETNTSQRLNSTSTVVINVLNENDNIPQFIGAPFNASVPENSEMGTSVITMKADDHDSLPFGRFHFSIEDSKPRNVFQIDASTGLVTVISGADLDREKHPSYSVTVSVTDVGGFLSRTQLIVNILDVNDNPPVFELKKYTFSINENRNDFIPRQFVRANDKDEPGNKNSNLTYSLSHAPASLESNFSIDPQSGEITLNKPLDFESLNDEPGITGGEVSLTVTVEDGGSPSMNDSVQVVITVMDENDNPPVFNIALHAKDIFENSTIGSLIAEVEAHDSDRTNNEVSYSIDTLSADTFTIDKTSGKITLTGKLDRETRDQYSIRVTAIDSGEPPRTATAVVDVTVIDINDEAPSFDEIRADLSISEHKMVNWTCQAKDSDKNPKLVYSIDWDKSSGQNGDGSALSGKELESWIEIDSDTCEVKSKSKEPLDREKVNQMTLQIQVEDVAGQVNKPQLATATLYINVLDVNDESPHFEGGSTIFYASVRENTPNGSQIYLDSGSGLIVVDKDQRGKNSAFRVILLNHTDIFEIEPDTGDSRQAVQLKVIKKNALDYEDCQQYTLELLAVETNTSQRLNSTSTVVINVLNENDNIPQFIGAPFNASVPENSEMGTSVITMKADDHDSLPFGRFHFSIEDSKPRNVFQIDASTGLVTVISGADLDREKHPSYSVTVSVTDVGGFLSRTQLIVNILDVNDNPPVFELKKYTFSINENRNDFIPRQFVRANDKDEPGNKNSNLTYSLSHAPASLESNFSIDPQSGEITLNKPLDFESLNDEPGITGGEVSLTVTVEDGGSPSMNDSVQVVITVMDENDNPPVFNIALHAKDIFENSTIGSLIAEVEAHDSDRTNNEVSYSIDTLSADTFNIDKTSGKITLTGKLDRETRDQYSIRVTAIDSGEPPRTATAVVHVNVIDINDEAPSFDEIRADLSISENKMVDWTCQAKDSDKNPKLVYSIDWDKSSGQNGDGSALSGKELESWIEIDSDTCEVKSKSKEPLDREKVNKMTLQIQVEDVAGQVNKPQLATATLYINVLDVNDESPRFEGGSTIFYASVRENTPNGSQIYLDSGSGLIVVDKDQRGKNSAFRVILLNHTDIFEIEPDTGDSRQAVQLKVIKKNALDYEDCQQYTLELLAVETNTSQRLNSTSTVVINVLNENDNIPQFIGAPFNASVPENSEMGTSVITMKADDHDSPPFGRFHFSIEDSKPSNAFQINDTTGLVTVVSCSDLDREKHSSFSLTVSVEDDGGFLSRTQLIVYLLDMNDESPSFENQYRISIKENENKFIPPLIVHATDEDEQGNKNSILTYNMSFVPVSLRSNFSIDPGSGEITLYNPLDFESLNDEPGISEGKVNLTVTVKDGGSPSLNDSVQVVITVKDENDNPPVFNQPIYSKAIFENSTKGSHIAEVNAYDWDVTNNKVSYIIDTLSAKTFEINKTSGKITLTGKLDRETREQYSIRVTAIDSGEPPRTATAVVDVTVRDINDEVPKFKTIRYDISVSENVNASWPCQVTDLDQDSKLVYSIDWDKSSGQDWAGSVIDGKDLNSWMEMETDGCKIKTRKPLDRETVSKMTLQIQVEDEKGLMYTPQIGTATFYIDVLDENDESPHFEGGPVFNASVRENTPKGTQIYLDNGSGLIVVDKDQQGKNSTFNVFLLNHTDIFKITPDSGASRQAIKLEVINDDALDYETTQQYTLELVAAENKTVEELSSTSTVIINVVNENDNIPQFIGGPFNAAVPENSEEGTSVITMQAEDDDCPPFASFHFGIEESALSQAFQIDIATGLVTVKSGVALDREKHPSISIIVNVTDTEGYFSRTQLIVNLQDMNDHAPKFETDYFAPIKENLDTFFPALTVHATDKDEPGNKNSNLTYSLSSVPASLGSNFSIDPQSGKITLNEPLDFESLNDEPGITGGEVSLTVTVKDGGSPSFNDSVQVVITVMDENDNPPVFGRNTYPTSVAENVPKGNVVQTMEVQDGDLTAPNNMTHCIIQSGGLDRFKIKPPCAIVVDQTLDREDLDNYELIVIAVDKGIPSFSTTATVQVKILDVDDTPPTLDQSNFKVDVWENETQNTQIFEFNATDADLNSSLSFTLLTDESIAIDEKNHVLHFEKFIEWFSVSTFEDTGILKVNASLDRELAQTLVLKIAVSDANAESNLPQVATATVTVSLIDVNDNPPVFAITESILHLKVSEAMYIGTEIKTFTATDADQDETVTFSLQQEVNATFFAITDSGKLTLYQLLDREETASINFTVLATDNGNPPKASRLPVSVTVSDVNDNDPVFGSSNYTFSVWENSNKSTAIGYVYATDRDAGQNANVTFYVQDESHFRINKLTGQIFVNGKIDREEHEQFSLTISARDNPRLDEPRKTSTVITVFVLDRNDETPEFNSGQYSAIISELKTSNTSLSVKPSIAATDKDKGMNAEVSFYFVNDSDARCFDINEDTGEVYVSCSTLKDLGGDYSYILEAKDHGDPPKSSTAALSITILDENIHSPEFVSEGPLPDIPECARIHSTIYTFNATDKDKNKENNGKVVYSLTGITAASNITRLLHIHPDTGVLTLEGKLDSATTEDLTFRVKAEDRGQPAKRSTLTDEIHLMVKDVNDHPPYFDNAPASFSIDEEIKKKGIFFVKALDKDKNSSLVYRLKGDFGHHFKIETDDKSGKISIVNPVDREMNESLTLTVIVEDLSAIQSYAMCEDLERPKTTAEKEITINVNDVNDNPPRFTRNQLSRGFLSTTEYGSNVLNLQEYVVDKDTPAVNHHRFALKGDIAADSPVNLRWSPQKNPKPITITPNGSVITDYAFSEDAKGLFHLRVSVSESIGNDTIDLKIYVVSDSQTVHITLDLTEEKLRTSKESIIKDLTESTLGYKFIGDNILPYSADEGVINGLRSVLVVHAVDAQDNVVDGDDLLAGIDEEQDLIEILKSRYSALKTEVGDSTSLKKGKNSDIRLEYILMGVIGLIVTAFAITLFFLLHNIQRFKRKLKAQTIEVHGMDQVQEKFPGLDNNIKDSNPIFMRHDISFDETSLNRPDFDGSQNGSQLSDDSLDRNEVGSLPSYPVSENDQEEQEATVNFYPSSHHDNNGRINLNTSNKHLSCINRAYQSNDELRQPEPDDDGIIRTGDLILNCPDDEDDEADNDLNIELDISQLECTDI